MRRRAPQPRLLPRPLILALLLGLLLTPGLAPLRGGPAIQASTETTMESKLLGWINDARAKKGLGKLRAASGLASVAGERASTLAAKKVLSHDAAGCLTCQVSAAGYSWKYLGEVLASNTYAWGTESAKVLFNSWKGSPEHWAILMNKNVDSIGIGVALASSTGTTYGSAIVVDLPGVSAIFPPKKVAPTPGPTPPPAIPTAEPTAPPTAAPTPVPAQTTCSHSH
jgi:uncharacterized protein YkwD